MRGFQTKTAVAAVAAGVLGAMGGFAISESTTPAATPRTAMTAAESPGGVNLTAGADIKYDNDGTGGFMTVNAAGEFCPMCGPSRGSGPAG